MIRFFEDRGVKISVTSDKKLTLKGMSKIDIDTRQVVLNFARDHKAAILSELQPPRPTTPKPKSEKNRAYWDSMIRCHVGIPSPGQAIEPAPSSQVEKTCPACGQSRWWRLDKPNSKWICGRCHPPAAGLDVIHE
jgi:hypothetical protein